MPVVVVGVAPSVGEQPDAALSFGVNRHCIYGEASPTVNGVADVAPPPVAELKTHWVPSAELAVGGLFGSYV